jgi:predicted nucleic acid-binding protein
VTDYYLDSSVAAHALLPDGDPRAATWMDQVITNGGRLVASRLLRLELTRLARRDRMSLAALEPVIARVDLAEIDRAAVDWAESIKPHVKALDALHLATAWLLDPDLVVATHDHTMAAAAVELGLATLDPFAAEEPSQEDTGPPDDDRSPTAAKRLPAHRPK